MVETEFSLGLYAKHVLVAWTGMFFAMFAIGLPLDSTPLQFLFDIPNAAPIFPGAIILGLIIGYTMNARERTSAACWVFILPLGFFLWGIYGDYVSIAPYGGWASVWRNEFSKHCGSSECLGEFLGTEPLYGALAYSFGAWWARRHPPKGANAERWEAWSRFAWRVANYSGYVILAWSIPWVLAWMYFGLGIYYKLHNAVLTVLLGPPVYLASILVPAPIGFLMNRRQRRRIPCWVWVPPVFGLLIEVLLVELLPSHLDLAPSAWRVFFNPGCGDNYECAKAMLFAVPAYGAIAYSLGALLARRRERVTPAAAAPSPGAVFERP